MKKTMLMLLAIVMIAVVAACGGNNAGNNGGNTANTDNNSNTASENTGENAESEQKASIKIGIAQLVEHPSLDSTREGFLQALNDAGYVEGENLEVEFQNAQNEPSNNVTIAQSFAAADKDLILTIATSTSQAVKQFVTDTPVVFTAITDPLGSELVESLEHPGGNVTGMSDTHPQEIEEMMTFISEEFPDIQTIGIVYNNGEQNSIAAVERVKAVSDQLGLTIVEASAINTSEVKQATESLVGKVDALYIPKDNVVVSGLQALLQVANEEDIPVFAAEKDTVGQGAFASFSVDYFDIGIQTGKMALEILEQGADPAELAVRFPDKLDLVLNLKAAEEQGIEVSDQLLEKVDKANIIE